MELRTFVSETLKQIIAGVVDAQQSARDQDAVVNPTVRGGRHADSIDPNGTLRQVISFDVAVTTVEGADREGGVGIFVGPLAIGGKGRSGSENTAVSRIEFDVPITLPAQKP